MPKDVLDIVLEEIQSLRKDVKDLNEKHEGLRIKVYLMAFGLSALGNGLGSLFSKIF